MKADSLLQQPGRAMSSRHFLRGESRARRAPRQPVPFRGPAFWVVLAVTATAAAGMAFAPQWAQVVLFLLLWGLLFAYTALYRRGRI